MVYGASGVGKSSLLRAGVIPTLDADDRTAVVYFNRWQDADCLTSLKRACLETVDTKTAAPSTIRRRRRSTCFSATFTVVRRRHSDSARSVRGVLPVPPQSASSLFDAELASAWNTRGIELGFALALRDDWLSRLDRFRGRVPQPARKYAAPRASRSPRGRGRGSEAAGGVSARWSSTHCHRGRACSGGIDEVGADQLLFGESAGRGQAKGQAGTLRVETAFLQLVMMRLWNEELSAGSATAAPEDVRTPRRRAQHRPGTSRYGVAALTPAEQESSARMFLFLVTPKGPRSHMKPRTLVEYAGRSAAEVQPVLEKLTAERVLRRISPPERYGSSTTSLDRPFSIGGRAIRASRS